LVAALANPDEEVNERAFDVLVTIGMPCVPTLVGYLGKTRDPAQLVQLILLFESIGPGAVVLFGNHLWRLGEAKTWHPMVGAQILRVLTNTLPEAMVFHVKTSPGCYEPSLWSSIRAAAASDQEAR